MKNCVVVVHVFCVSVVNTYNKLHVREIEIEIVIEIVT